MERKTNQFLYCMVVFAIIFFGSFAYLRKNPPSKILALDVPFDLVKTETKQTQPQHPLQTCDAGLPNSDQNKPDLGTLTKKDPDITVPKVEKKKDKPKPAKKPAPKWYQIFSETDSFANIAIVRQMRKELRLMIFRCIANGYVDHGLNNHRSENLVIKCPSACCNVSFLVGDLGTKTSYKATFDYCNQTVDNIKVFSSREDPYDGYLALKVVLLHPICEIRRGGGIDE